MYGAVTLSGCAFQRSSTKVSQYRLPVHNPREQAPWFGLFPVRSPLLRKSLFIFSSSGYLDVSVPRVPSVNLWIQLMVMESSSIGFPHSEICGSMLACSSPQLIAAGHVLHRRMVPWHPPCALISLIFSSLRPETNCLLLSLYEHRSLDLSHSRCSFSVSQLAFH